MYREKVKPGHIIFVDTVLVDRSGLSRSIEQETCGLVKIILLSLGCQLTNIKSNADFIVDTTLYEREFASGWKTKRSVTVDMKIVSNNDGDADSVGENEPKLYAQSVIIMTCDGGLSSSFNTEKLLRKSATEALKLLARAVWSKNETE
jgi:hypothetical protein